MVHIAKITSSITHPLVFVVLLGTHVTVFGVACQPLFLAGPEVQRARLYRFMVT